MQIANKERKQHVRHSFQPDTSLPLLPLRLTSELHMSQRTAFSRFSSAGTGNFLFTD